MREESRRGWWDARLIEEFRALMDTGKPDSSARHPAYSAAD